MNQLRYLLILYLYIDLFEHSLELRIYKAQDITSYEEDLFILSGLNTTLYLNFLHG
jgi:hypothetical protein